MLITTPPSILVLRVEATALCLPDKLSTTVQTFTPWWEGEGQLWLRWVSKCYNLKAPKGYDKKRSMFVHLSGI